MFGKLNVNVSRGGWRCKGLEMIIIVNDDPQAVFIVDFTAAFYDQIRLSIMAAQNCDFQQMRELASDLKVGVRTIDKEPVMCLGWDEVTFLMAVMVNAATEKVTRDSAKVIDEINQALTCAVEMGMV